MASNTTPTSHHATAEAALRAAEARFIANNPLSKTQHDLAVGTLPGGNTRTVLHTSPFPLSMKRGEATHVWDLDDHRSAPIHPFSTTTPLIPLTDTST